jgi:hypothetical protein
MSDDDAELPIEHFIQALTSQLDRAQETMALKARAGMPLTFAVKDLQLELRAHVGMRGNVVRIRPAGPGDGAASVINLSLTTITRPMIEENTTPLAGRSDEPSLKEAFGDEISEEEQRRLEWAGIRSVSQLRDLERDSGEAAIERVSELPVGRLRAALAAASRPRVREVVPDRGAGGPLLRIRGLNLMNGAEPEVRVGDAPATVIEASARELVVRPLSDEPSGTVEVHTDGQVATGSFGEAAP